VDAFCGSSFGRIETEDLKIEEDDVYQVADNKKGLMDHLYFIKTGGTIDSTNTGSGLTADQNYTIAFLEDLSKKSLYFNQFETIAINPKDSSLFNPDDWTMILEAIEKTQLSKIDTDFDWKIMCIITSPFQTKELYEFLAHEVIENYSGAVILGYGAGNVNIMGSYKTASTKAYTSQFSQTYGGSALNRQKRYSFIPLLQMLEDYNHEYPENYKFMVMNSQVPIDNYDIDYEAGRIPLYYGALPSGDLSYPEAQTKLAFILGHKKLIQQAAHENNLSYEQLVKSRFLSGVKFNRKMNRDEFLRISEKECGCRVRIHPKNVFVKNSFLQGLSQIIALYKK